VPKILLQFKVDKLKKGELDVVLGATKEALKKRPAAHPEVLPISSHETLGIGQLREEIATFSVD
jgi:GTP-binding protein